MVLILLGSALGSPTFSTYAVTTNHVKSLKESDINEQKYKHNCDSDKDFQQ